MGLDRSFGEVARPRNKDTGEQTPSDRFAYVDGQAKFGDAALGLGISSFRELKLLGRGGNVPDRLRCGAPRPSYRRFLCNCGQSSLTTCTLSRIFFSSTHKSTR